MRCASLLAVVTLFSVSLFAQGNFGTVVDCGSGASLQNAISSALPNSTLIVRGNCPRPVTIKTDGLRLLGNGTASITSDTGGDVVAVVGAQRVELNGLAIAGGTNGVLATNVAQVKLVNDGVRANVVGVEVQSNSSVVISGGDESGNSVSGIDVESTSSVTITGSHSLNGNGVGLMVNNGSSVRLSQANVTASLGLVGVQLGTNAAGFIDQLSILDVSGNEVGGLTINSGSHMVVFGGTIHIIGGGGISLASKSGLDLDAGAQVQILGCGSDGVHLEQESVLRIFNNPQLSGASGTTTLSTQGNQGNGINLQLASTALVDNYAAIVSMGNVQAGVASDDGSSLQFRQTIPVNNVQTTITSNSPDLLLTFGSRLTLLSNDVFVTVSCDSTVLTRGPGAPACPQIAVKRK